MHRFIVGLVLAAMSTPASGATVDIAAPLRAVAQQQRAISDETDHIDRFNHVIKIITSSATCRRFGVTVDDEGVQELARRTVAEAVIGSLTQDVATASFIKQMHDEGDKLRAATDEAVRQGTEESIKGLIDFWGERCRDLMNDPVTGRYFHH